MAVLSTLLITISESIFGQLGSTAVPNPTAGFACFLFQIVTNSVPSWSPIFGNLLVF